MNKVMLIGRLVQNPDVQYTPKGKVVCSFCIAVNGQSTEAANFIDCIVWEKLAEVCANYLSKGRRVAVDGQLFTKNVFTTTGGNLAQIVSAKIRVTDVTELA